MLTSLKRFVELLISVFDVYDLVGQQYQLFLGCATHSDILVCDLSRCVIISQHHSVRVLLINRVENLTPSLATSFRMPLFLILSLDTSGLIFCLLNHDCVLGLCD